MKKFPLGALAAALLIATPVFADDAHHPEKSPESAAAALPAAPQIKKMQDNARKMSGQLERIAKAKTEAERSKAMHDHMQTLHENMLMARGMQAGGMGCAMPGGGMGMMDKEGMGMMGARSAEAQSGGMERMQQMEKRLDMMQMMMEQMMGRREVGPAAPMPMK